MLPRSFLRVALPVFAVVVLAACLTPRGPGTCASLGLGSPDCSGQEVRRPRMIVCSGRPEAPQWWFWNGVECLPLLNDQQRPLCPPSTPFSTDTDEWQLFTTAHECREVYAVCTDRGGA